MASQSDVKNAIVGSWHLITLRAELMEEGGTAYPMGKDARGIITYSPNGYMAVQLMPSATTKAKSTIHDILAYTGRYWTEVQSDGIMIVKQQMEMCTQPDLEGSTQQRIVTISENQMELASPAFFQFKVIYFVHRNIVGIIHR